MFWFVAPFVAGYVAGNWVQDRVDVACKVRTGTGPDSVSRPRPETAPSLTVSVTARHVAAVAGAQKSSQGFTLDELGDLFGRRNLSRVSEGVEPQVLLGRALVGDTTDDGTGVVPIDRFRGCVQDVWVAAGQKGGLIFVIGNKIDGYRNLVFKHLAGRYYPRNAQGVPIRRSEAVRMLADMYTVLRIHNDRLRNRAVVRSDDAPRPMIRLMD